MSTEAWDPSPKQVWWLPLPPYLPTTESDTKPLIRHESLRSTSHLVALDNIRPLAPWKGQQFILNKIDIFSKCEFTFHICFEVVSTSTQGLTKHLIH